MITFQTHLKNSRKPTQPRIRFDLEKLNNPTVMSVFRAIIGGRFAPLATQVDEDADLDSMVTHFNKAVTDTAGELLGKQRRKRKPLVTPEILDLCDQRRDLKKKRGEPEGAKDYREINRKIWTEMKIAKESVCVSRLVRFAGLSGRVVDFGARDKGLAARLLQRGYRCRGLRRAFSGFCRRRCGLVSKFGVGLRALLRQGLSEPEFYGDLVYKLKKIVGGADFSDQFRKIIVRYTRVGYGMNIMRRSACLVFGPVAVGGFASLFGCTPVSSCGCAVWWP